MPLQAMNAGKLNRQGPFPGTEDDNGIEIVDRLLPPQTISQFLESCGHQELPNGEKFSQRTISEVEEMEMFMSPYTEWADPAFHHMTDPVIEQLMIRIGSFEDGDRLSLATQPLHHMKSRIWEGMIPMSDNRWHTLELDDPKHHRLACEHIGTVLRVFEYLNHPQNILNLRTTFNLILEHLTDFDNAINMVRERQNNEAISMANAWVEFIEAHYQIMTTRAHGWVVRKIGPMLEGIILDMQAHQTEPAFDFNMQQWKMADRFHDLIELSMRVDCAIFMPMEGYTGYVSSPRSAHYSPVHEKRLDVIFPLTKIRRQEKEDFYMLQAYLRGPNAELAPGSVSVANVAHRCIEQKEAVQELRFELRGSEKAPGMETWIRRIHRLNFSSPESAPKPTGLVIYRLTYEQSDETWAHFKQAFEADLANWGDGVVGSETVRDLLKLHWLDGDALGLGERHIEAAKRHFEAYTKEETFPATFETGVFLAVDSESVASYLSSPLNTATAVSSTATTTTASRPSNPYSGENTGFILVVDADFDPDDPADDNRDEESPGYSGVVQILGNLVWGNLFAMIKAQAQWPWDLWPSAMEHPDTIYVGPVVQWMRNRWANGGGDTTE